MIQLVRMRPQVVLPLAQDIHTQPQIGGDGDRQPVGGKNEQNPQTVGQLVLSDVITQQMKTVHGDSGWGPGCAAQAAGRRKAAGCAPTAFVHTYNTKAFDLKIVGVLATGWRVGTGAVDEYRQANARKNIATKKQYFGIFSMTLKP